MDLAAPSRPLVGAVDDLGVILARLDVVWDEGWWPAQPDRDAPRTDSGEDDVAGPRWDFGLGSHRARQAWHRLERHLDTADDLSRLVLAYLAPGSYRAVTPQGPTIHADPRVTGSDTEAPRGAHGRTEPRIRPVPSLASTRTSVLMLRKRLGGLQRLRDGTYPSDVAQWIETSLAGRAGHPEGTVCWHVEHARHAVVGIVAVVGNGKAPRICGSCRQPGTVGDPHRKGWCAACYRAWFRKGNGVGLPKRPRRAIMTDIR